MSDTRLMESIARLVPPGSRVLDLGCGDGAMLAHLQATRACSGYGVEIDDAKVLACVKRGVNVLQLNLEGGLTIEKSFGLHEGEEVHRWPNLLASTAVFRFTT